MSVGPPLIHLSELAVHEATSLGGKLADPSGNVIEVKYYDDPDALRMGTARP